MTENKNWMEKAMALDRRWIFLAVALSVVLPIIFGVALDVDESPEVKSIYRTIEDLPAGSVIMIVCDYDPASEAELYPMTLALYRHCFDKGHKVLSFTMWPNGAALIERAFDEVKLDVDPETGLPKYQLESGVDYINYGYQVGGVYNIIQAGINLRNTFPSDYRGQSVNNMPILEGINSLTDLAYLIDLAAGSTVDWWVAYGVQRYHFLMGAGCTAVSATQYYPYLNTGQINGLMGGLKGAAEYEQMSGHPGNGLAGMTAQSSVHVLIIFMVVIANAFYFMTRKGRR